MKRRTFVGGALAGTSVTGASAKPAKLKSGDDSNYALWQDRRAGDGDRSGRRAWICIPT